MAAKSVETRTLLITKRDGEEIQIDIPATYKVTFGPAFITSKAYVGGKQVPMALRVYESDKMQLAIFTDVVSFRDLNIPMRVKQVKTQEKDGYIECEGVRKRTTFSATTSEWVNADAGPVGPKLLQMPQDEEIFGAAKS